MNTVLEVANVEKYYGNKGNLTKALDKISFQVEEGEFVGIMGRQALKDNTFELFVYHRPDYQREDCGG